MEKKEFKKLKKAELVEIASNQDFKLKCADVLINAYKRAVNKLSIKKDGNK